MKQNLVKPILLSLPYQIKSCFVLVSIGHPLGLTEICFFKKIDKLSEQS